MSAATQGNESCLPPSKDAAQTDFPAAPTPPVVRPDLVGLPTLAVPGEGTFVVRHGLDSIATICSAGMTPRVVTGLLLRTLKNHFADPDLILDPKLQKYVWNQDSSKSKIRIIQNAFFDAKSAGQFPAIVVGRGNLESKRVAMDDKAQSTNDPIAMAMAGITKYTRFHLVQYTVTCIAENVGEADDLAMEVFDTFSYLSPMMTERLPFHDFQVVGMGALGALTDVGTQLAVPVQLTMAYEYAWTLQPLAPRTKTLSIHPT